MRLLTLTLSLWLAAGCGVARESLGELAQAGKRGVLVAGSGGAGKHAEPEQDAGQPAAGSGGDTAITDSGTKAPDKCAAESCDAAARPLEDYCGLEQARCPLMLGNGRSRVCETALHKGAAYSRAIITQHVELANTCGGTTIRMGFAYGSVEYHYGADEKLRAVTTLTPALAGPCAAMFYRYGDLGCATTGDLLEIRCAS